MNNPATNPHNVQNNSYDEHLVPAETAARQVREGDEYKKIPDEFESTDSVNASGGHTVDSEGLSNNYAIEPEMYYEVPGDLTEATDSDTAKPPKDSSTTLGDRLKSTVKNIEGKLQETVGAAIGNPKAEAEGQAKQLNAMVHNNSEEI